MSHCSEQTAVEVWQPVSPNGTDDDNNNGEKNKTKKLTLKKKSAWQAINRGSSLKGQERATISQMNTGTVSKAMMGKLLRDGMEHIIMGFSKRIDTILNWTELNWTMNGLQLSKLGDTPGLITTRLKDLLPQS